MRLLLQSGVGPRAHFLIVITLTIFFGSKAYALSANAQDTAIQYLRWNRVGEQHTIKTDKPLRFYFENVDEDDVYLKLLPSVNPGEFRVELRKMTNTKPEDLLIDAENAKNQARTLEQKVVKLENETAVAQQQSKLIVNKLPAVLQRLTVEKLGPVQSKPLVHHDVTQVGELLKKNEADLKSNNERIGTLRREIDSLVRVKADPKLINAKRAELEELLERNSLLMAERNALEMQKDYLQSQNDLLDSENRANELELSSQRMIIWGLSLFSLLLVLIAYIIYRNYREKKVLNSKLHEKNIALDKEQEISNGLLLNILPKPIAERLKSGESTIVDFFAEATVMFIDIAGFTKLTSAVRPESLVQMLNTIFTRLDALTEKHGLEKIKTIGDAYMVASGLPHARKDHAEAAANMALDVLKALHDIEAPDGSKLNVRVGLASGSAIAGVIGKKKYIYDLWGDSVNTASRMESTGSIGHIHCTEQVYDRLHKKYKFTKRGEIEVKGKGTMTTYFLDAAA